MALYNNLAPGGRAGAAGDGGDGDATGQTNMQREQLALAIDEAVRHVRQDDWRGNQARENLIKKALMPLLRNDADEVERVFAIVKNQGEY